MFHRLLVPLDGSRLAESVIPVVLRLSELTACTVNLLHVIEKRPPTSIHGDVHLQEPAEAESYLEAIAGRLTSVGIPVEAHVHTVPQGDVPRSIAEHAVELDQDLIVLCRHGAGGVRRFVFGTNAEQVLAHGETPVLLIQTDERGVAPPFGPERILVLVDTMRVAEPVVNMGESLATAAAARMHLLAVIPTRGNMPSEQAATGRLAPQATREILQMAAEEAAVNLQKRVDELTAKGIAASGRIERGDIASEVVEVARTTHADLVVLASSGLAGLSAFWANTLARKVASEYDGALLLIRQTEQ